MKSYADINIFSDKLFLQPVTYQPARELLNNDGVFYAEYGVHNEDYDIDAVFFDGRKNTKVFAYIGVPKRKGKMPAVVLLHGGLGKAEISWVKKWNDRGFVAIAPDLYGDGPEKDMKNPYRTNMKRHPYAGVYPWDENAFLTDYESAGMFQNTVTSIYAHNLLRCLQCVDKTKIGIVGISWGGVATTIAAGVDSRFLFAESIYGCGHIAESYTYFRESICRPESTTKWDPSNFVSLAKMPILYINGNSDEHFSLNMTSNTFQDTPLAQMAIYNGLMHSQEAGEEIAQAYDFAKNMVLGKTFIPKICCISAKNNKFSVRIENADIISGVFYYHSPNKFRYDRGTELTWKTVEEYECVDNDYVFIYPPDADYGYATFKFSEYNYASTPYMKLK